MATLCEAFIFLSHICILSPQNGTSLCHICSVYPQISGLHAAPGIHVMAVSYLWQSFFLMLSAVCDHVYQIPHKCGTLWPWPQQTWFTQTGGLAYSPPPCYCHVTQQPCHMTPDILHKFPKRLSANPNIVTGHLTLGVWLIRTGHINPGVWLKTSCCINLSCVGHLNNFLIYVEIKRL